MYRRQLYLFHPYTRKFNPSITVYKDGKEIGEYQKIDGAYTVWVMNIGRMSMTYKNRKEAFQAIKDNYIR